MDEKKSPTRFTIQFGSDPRSLAVVDLLNSYGRKKAQVIVDAILHYTNCDQTPGERLPDGRHLEQLVRSLVSQEMKRQGLCGGETLPKTQAVPPDPVRTPPHPDEDHRVPLGDLSPESAALISGALAAFRQIE